VTTTPKTTPEPIMTREQLESAKRKLELALRALNRAESFVNPYGPRRAEKARRDIESSYCWALDAGKLMQECVRKYDTGR